MQCHHCAHPDSIRYGASRGVQRYRCQACRRIFQTRRRDKDPALKQQASQLYLDWSKLPSHSQQAHHKPKSAPSSESINSARSSLKKSQCWLWLAVDSIFGKVLGFARGRRTIKTGQVLWQQIKHLPTMGYGTDMLKSYENFIPHDKHYASKTFTTQIESLNCRLRHYLARLHRKKLCYDKSKTMLEVSLKLLIHKLNNP